MNRQFTFYIFTRLILLTTLFSSIILTSPVYAATTITVMNASDSGAGSLRQGIADVADGGAIVFAAGLSGATIHLASTLTLSKNIIINGSALASKITISGDTDGDGTGNVRVFYLNSNMTAVFNSLIITKGVAPASDGGGVYNGGTLTITNSTFSSNGAVNGGGINSGNGTLTIMNCIFSDNYATNGGGISVGTSSGTLTVTNSTFSSNSATSNGGSILNSGKMIVTNSSFSDGYAAGGGGEIFNVQSPSVTITNSKFTGSPAGINSGGAIYNNSHSTTTITNSLFSAKSSGYGGAIYNNNSKMTIVSSTFSNNSATVLGGGITNSTNAEMDIANSTFSGNSSLNSGGAIHNALSSTITIRNSTFSGNTAPNFGGSIYNNSSTLNYVNTIIANTIAGGDCYNFSGTISINVNNLVEDGSCSPAMSGDPNLGPLADNGGPTETFALLSGSPAIDAGNDVICSASPVDGLDQRGKHRPQGAQCDIGAYENPSIFNSESQGGQDGWIVESTETSNLGGAKNNISKTFNLGDDANDKQYRAILSFNTASLPDNAAITKVIFEVKKGGITGKGNPVSIFKGFMADIKKGMFGKSSLEIGDFKTAASKMYGPFTPTILSDWYSIDLTPANSYINTFGLTQIRLRFKVDDNNNNSANLLKLYSGNAPAGSRPQLIIEYYAP